MNTETSAPPSAGATPIPTSPAQQAATVLVVDDDRTTRAMVRAVLARQRYRIVEAADGEEAVQAAVALRPDLILLDVMMPTLDGHAACARIRAALQDDALPIVMLTAADDLASIEAAFQAGATDFITKPIHWSLLRERVRYALRSGQLAREVRRARLRETAVRRIAGLGYWEWRLDTDRLAWSGEFEPLAGIRANEDVPREAFLQVVHPDDRSRLSAALDRARETGVRLDLEFRACVRGEERVIRVMGERGERGDEADRVLGAFQDLTPVRKAEALADYLTLHDEATGLPNRRWFLRRAAERIAAVSAGADTALVIAVVDIHRFARFNESLGEQRANQLLAALGARLRQLVDSGVLVEVARIGGDDFALALRADDATGAKGRLGQVLVALGQPVRVGAQELTVPCSIGWAACPQHGRDPEVLLTFAQEAQRRARALGRDLLGADTDDTQADRRQRTLALEQALRGALERGEFRLVYQPQLDVVHGCIVGCEALLRWQTPAWGDVPPAEFVPLLEESGLIIDVGAWVMETAARQAAAWERSGLPLRVGVNLSPRQFLSPELLTHIERALRVSGVSPGLLEFEITESLAVQDVSHAARLLQTLRGMGLKVALDDFGIGHSSLAYMLQFPIDVIKIDRVFVAHITRGPTDRAIVRAVVALSQSLGVETIAEGVETQRQCDFLEAIGVGQIQGYLIGRPMPAADVERLARQWRRRTD